MRNLVTFWIALSIVASLFAFNPAFAGENPTKVGSTYICVTADKSCRDWAQRLNSETSNKASSDLLYFLAKNPLPRNSAIDDAYEAGYQDGYADGERD